MYWLILLFISCNTVLNQANIFTKVTKDNVKYDNLNYILCRVITTWHNLFDSKQNIYKLI